jgi:hypothetical protein
MRIDNSNALNQAPGCKRCKSLVKKDKIEIVSINCSEPLLVNKEL